MPTYDYIGTSCGNAWELEQRIVEDPVKKCPKCKASTAKRQISSGAGFILKGGGWYADGYGSKKPSSGESKSDDKGPKTETKSDAKSETQSEGKKSESKSSKSDDAKKPEPKGSGGGGSGSGGDAKAS